MVKRFFLLRKSSSRWGLQWSYTCLISYGFKPEKYSPYKIKIKSFKYDKIWVQNNVWVLRTLLWYWIHFWQVRKRGFIVVQNSWIKRRCYKSLSRSWYYDLKFPLYCFIDWLIWRLHTIYLRDKRIEIDKSKWKNRHFKNLYSLAVW